MLRGRTRSRRSERRAATALILSLCVVGTVLAVGLAPEGQGPVWGVAGLAGSLALAGLVVRGRRGVPVLTYHSVSPQADWLPWAAETSIRPETLDRHLHLFRRMGYDILQTEEWVRARREGLALPRRPLLLHFDDGYLDNRLHAWPILRKHGATATLFVSTDFVAPGTDLRDRGPDDGYLNWEELRQMDRAPEWRVEAHGTDHGRVPTGPGRVGVLTAATLGTEAWMQWARMPGDKHDWYRRAPVVPVGTPIPESRPALAGLALGETEADYRDRVARTLTMARDRIAAKLGRVPRLFCWPQNETSASARRIAAEAGFIATTAASHRNTAADPWTDLSRLHAGQDHAGLPSSWIDDLAMRAHLRCFEGVFIWALPLAAIGLLRRIVTRAGARTDRVRSMPEKVQRT